MKFKIGDFELDAMMTFWQITTVTLFSLLIYFVRNPEKLEKLAALIYKTLKGIWRFAEYGYIKYDLQSKLNDYIKKVHKKTKHLDAIKAEVKWVDKNQTASNFINDGKVVIRMAKSENQNDNLVRATMTFVSEAFLRKAKSYVAKYQRESLDLFVCYDLLKVEKSEVLDQFVQRFMKEKMDKDKIANFFEKFSDIRTAGVFYPILVQELSFLGEKVFAKKRERSKVYEEVTGLVNFLYSYSNRKINENIVTEFNGNYCKFAIRILGKSFKVEKQGTRVYTNNIKKIASNIETLYLISGKERVKFVRSVFNNCKEEIGFKCITQKPYRAQIKDPEGELFWVDNFIMVCRSEKINVYHKK